MKKVFTVLSLAVVFVACNNGAEKKAEGGDSAAHATVDTTTHVADTSHAAADTTKHADTAKHAAPEHH